MAQDKNNIRLTDKQSIPRVVAAMTAAEKVSLVTGMGLKIEGLPPGLLPPGDPKDDDIPEKVPGAAGRTHAIPRLGIPTIILSDGPAGIRINPYRNSDSTKPYFATGFPVATLLASSWDTALVTQIGKAMGKEALEYGIDVILGPGMNLQRNPLGGRNFEYYSEDPLLTGHMAAAMVRGVQSTGVGTSIKHFAANNQEFNRMQLNTIVSQRALRELYLRGFQLAVKHGQPWTVMSSYNKINGVYTSENPVLLKRILRDEWKFKGTVITDWFGGTNPAQQLNAWNNLLMPGFYAQSQALLGALQDGSLSAQTLDANVAAILQLVVQSPVFKKYKYSDKPDLSASAAIVRRAAAESMVLLKNDSALPITAPGKIALFGVTSYKLIAGGTGSGDVNKAYVTDLDKAMLQGGYVLDAGLQTEYGRYITEKTAQLPKSPSLFSTPPPIPEQQPDSEAISRLAKYMDVAIITIGRNAGEGSDRNIENDFLLREDERTMLKVISEAFHANNKKVVVVLNIGGVIETASWRQYADAILLAWQPGQEGGSSIADVISGNINPSGRLAASFPMQYTDVPSSAGFPGKELPGGSNNGNPMMGKPSEVQYTEDIYVGYRGYTTNNIATAFPFGYGLSYTNFTYSRPRVTSAPGVAPIRVAVTVTNSGNRPGREVVQLYVSAPAIKQGRPVRELKAFAKTGILPPGGKETVQLTLGMSDLAWFDEARMAWVVTPGTYKLEIGANAEMVITSTEYKIGKEMMLEKNLAAL
ncbi:glycoside hydrolase family 3 protein [Chitinophaga sp. sic0106]|uniref:beta-glucosidase n=1 Tax=Chitinophaga sp. sic0106 TaxID=2854785 RepID=UPI001C453349|nr:glycoside hydrolase family 3 C-terminal domain-containing protein [Chitinophaga sp. sic0106]MBV7529096.1 glycoside hydrolase family 3 C-terminal domain-containing protein [Chitinophaga sp. sic0106]